MIKRMQGGHGVGEVPFQFASAKSEGATDLLFSQNPEMKEKKKQPKIPPIVTIESVSWE